MLKLKLFLIPALLLAISGCVQQPKTIPVLSVSNREQIINHMQNWQANGKLGIRFEHTGHNISFEWRQRKNNYFLYLYSLLASESARIKGSPKGATLVTLDKQEYTAPTADRLVYEHMGWELPVSKLLYWIRGIPDPYSASRVANYDAYNQLSTLRQDGWLIEYQSYHIMEPVSLPEKMTISNSKITLKFIVRDWKIKRN